MFRISLFLLVIFYQGFALCMEGFIPGPGEEITPVAIARMAGAELTSESISGLSEKCCKRALVYVHSMLKCAHRDNMAYVNQTYALRQELFAAHRSAVMQITKLARENEALRVEVVKLKGELGALALRLEGESKVDNG